MTTGGGRRGVGWLVVLALFAIVVTAAVIWQQSEGARPVAGRSPAPRPSRSVLPPSDTGFVGDAMPVMPATPVSPPASMPPPGARIPAGITVRGTVAGIDDHGEQAVVAVLTDDGRGTVYAMLRGEDRPALALLDEGAEVRLRCAGSRTVDGATIMEDCRL